MSSPRSLIINSPYERPLFHWREVAPDKLVVEKGRRPASYEIFDTRAETRRTVLLERVNQIREKVDVWREAGRPGISIVTKRLLEHWEDREARTYPFYFAQLEAIETLIWWVEAFPEYKKGIVIPGDGGPWERLCSKMATGTGKTTVMAMIIAWQALNAMTNPNSPHKFSRAFFVVAPNLTVKERLQVLLPGHPANVYDEFSICPSEALRQKLNQAEIVIENWHALMPLKEPERSVVKKGPESDRAFVKRVLGHVSRHKNIVVINDEAHHAYRIPAELKVSKKDAEEQGFDTEQATRWVEGLDRIHRQIGIGRCFDLSATPFAPTGKTNTEQALFDWIVSDFGLNDAIEAGLVKTPRVVVRDGVIPDSKTLKPKLYHIYRDPTVSDDLNRRAQPHEPLPELVKHAYTLLGADWRETAKQWREAGHPIPPAMLTVCNRTETAARIEHYFLHGDAHWPELHAPERTLRIDSKVLDKVERGESGSVEKGYEERLNAILEAANIPHDEKARLSQLKKDELLRELVDTVGKRDRAGQDLQNVISVAMLSEGWDAKNVTHIMGLRAFTSQLLCEQVIGRGLRRVSYDTEEVEGPDGVVRTLFCPEYVNVFGVPLSIFERADQFDGEGTRHPKSSTLIEVVPGRGELEITWPNVLRIETVTKPTLTIDWSEVEPLRLDPATIPISAEIAPALGGAVDCSKVEKIDLSQIPDSFRIQRLTFIAVRKAFEAMRGRFKGNRDVLAFQLVRLTEEFLKSDKLVIPSDFHNEPLRRRILIGLSIDRIVQHLVRFLTEQNLEKLELIYDEEKDIRSTGEMPPWHTTKKCQPTNRSQISHVVVDSPWEAYAAGVLEKSPHVVAYAKNDHLRFYIQYMWNGATRRYIPDYLIRLTNGKTLVLEVKGRDSDEVRMKFSALRHWVEAVNASGRHGKWACDILYDPARMHDVLAKHAES